MAFLYSFNYDFKYLFESYMDVALLGYVDTFSVTTISRTTLSTVKCLDNAAIHVPL